MTTKMNAIAWSDQDFLRQTSEPKDIKIQEKKRQEIIRPLF